MTATKGMSLTALVLLATSVMGQQCRSVHVADVKSIFAIAPSPVGAKVLFYGSAEEAEGEIVTGSVFRLRLDGAESNNLRLKAPDASNPSAPVWQRDGSSAYFETDQGIYQLSPADGEPEPLWKGPSTGLAISPDGLFLAFWRVEKGTDTLVLYDLKKKSEARAWPVPDRFESDKAGWDMAFAHDGHALYARTYDEASSTPLKRFDISSGKVTVVSPDVYAVAEGKEAVFFIAVSGTTRSLHKIAATGHSGLAAKEFGYDSLSSGGNPRWLVSQDYRSKEIVVVDTETDAIKSIGKHDSAAVLPDGKLLMVSGPEITVGDPSCKPKEQTETVDPKTGNFPIGSIWIRKSKGTPAVAAFSTTPYALLCVASLVGKYPLHTSACFLVRTSPWVWGSRPIGPPPRLLLSAWPRFPAEGWPHMDSPRTE